MTFDELLKIKRTIESYKHTLKVVAKISKDTIDIMQVVVEDTNKSIYLEPKDKDIVYHNLLDVIRDYGDNSISTSFITLCSIFFKAIGDIKGNIRLSLTIDNIKVSLLSMRVTDNRYSTLAITDKEKELDFTVIIVLGDINVSKARNRLFNIERYFFPLKKYYLSNQISYLY